MYFHLDNFDVFPHDADVFVPGRRCVAVSITQAVKHFVGENAGFSLS